MHRPLTRAAVALVLAGVAVGAPAAPAAAVAPVEYSLDGATWSSTPPASLFPGFTIVPGDRETMTLFLRSTRAEASVLTLAVRDARASDPIMATGLTLDSDDTTGAGMAPTRLRAIADCTAAVPPRLVTAGQVVPVTFELAMSPTLDDADAQDSWATFDVVIGLADPGAPMDASGCPIGAVIPGTPTGPDAGGGGDAGGMAATGSDVVPRTAAVALTVLAGGGLLLLVARRRRRPETAA